MHRLFWMSMFACAMAATPALASTSAADAVVDRTSAAACARVSGLRDARVGPITRFSDRFGIDVRTVSGTWPQPHMKGARGSVLCVYDRRTGQAETQEPVAGAASAVPVADSGLKDRVWRLSELEGRPPVGPRPLTMMLGSDGKLTGNSGCNSYSANYALTGLSLRVYRPLIGTQMSCGATANAQERRFQSILQAAQSLTRGPGGSVILTATDGRAIRFVERSR